MMTVADAVSVDLSASDWRAVVLAGGVAFVRSPDYDACGGDVGYASFTVWIGPVDRPQDASVDPVDALMRRRVRQGRPEESAAVVAGAPTTRLEYTDGVQRIHSYFVRRPSGAIIEITLATHRHPTGQWKVELESAADDVFGHLRWL